MKYLKLSLIIGFCVLIVACKTTQLTSKKYEGRTTSAERADTFIEHDSILMFVHESADTVRIVQREIKWKERVALRHDTLLVVKTDTVFKTIEPLIRSPASTLSTLRSWLRVVLTAIVIIIIIIITFKIKKTWDKLI